MDIITLSPFFISPPISRRSILDLLIKDLYYAQFTQEEYENDVHKRNDIEKWVENIMNAVIVMYHSLSWQANIGQCP